MPCYYPIKGYRARSLNENGKRPIVFNAKDGYADMPVTVPCGRCIGCRLEYSRQWAIRCVHEAQMHEKNAFITLTFNKENLPEDYSVQKWHLQKFFRRMRKKGIKMRYFACGEYGEQKSRPHYHALIFGYDFPDKEIWSYNNGNPLWRSRELETLWPYGYCMIGEVTFESAAYVARYVMKKWKKDGREDDTEVQMANAVVDRETGEIHEINPEFVLMSRRPGIGSAWLQKYTSDTDKDFITINGKVMSLPRYYDKLLEEKDPEDMMRRKQKRIEKFNENPEEHMTDRLRVKEKVKEAQINMLSRKIEEQT